MFQQYIPQNDPYASGVMAFNLNARPLFEKARRRAAIMQTLHRLIGKSRALDHLASYSSNTVRLCPETRTTQVHINQIRGSVNRIREFDRDFYPLTDDVETRWVRIASMMMQSRTLPPVELLRVDDDYYVIEGHHRISVSRMLGYAYVDAIVQCAES